MEHVRTLMPSRSPTPSHNGPNILDTAVTTLVDVVRVEGLAASHAPFTVMRFREGQPQAAAEPRNQQLALAPVADAGSGVPRGV